MSTNYPYQPIRQPKPEVSQSDMFAILQKHSDRIKGLEWMKPEKGATGVRTVCGRYSCSKVTVGGKLSYEVWKQVPNQPAFEPVAMNLDSFETAKRLANEDLQGCGGSGEKSEVDQLTVPHEMVSPGDPQGISSPTPAPSEIPPCAKPSSL